MKMNEQTNKINKLHKGLLIHFVFFFILVRNASSITSIIDLKERDGECNVTYAIF